MMRIVSAVLSVYERISDRQRFVKCVVSFNCLLIDREFNDPIRFSGWGCWFLG